MTIGLSIVTGAVVVALALIAAAAGFVGAYIFFKGVEVGANLAGYQGDILESEPEEYRPETAE